MLYLFNFLIALFVWLGLFRLDLVSALLSQPIGTVIAALTGFDLLLLAVTFIAVTGAMHLLDGFIASKKRLRKS